MRPARYGPGEQVIAAWPLTNGEELRLTTCHFKRGRFLDLRRWARNGDEWRPTPRGIRFNDALAGPLAELLSQAAGERAA